MKTTTEQRYKVTASSCYGIADYIVFVPANKTITQAFEEQFPRPLIGGSDRKIISTNKE